MTVGALRNQKRTFNHLELELKMAVSYSTWVLETELQSSKKVARALNPSHLSLALRISMLLAIMFLSRHVLIYPCHSKNVDLALSFLPFLFLLSFSFFLRGSHVPQANLEPPVQPRMTLNWSGLQLPISRMTSVHHQAKFMQWWGLNPEPELHA